MLDWLLDRVPIAVSGPIDRRTPHGVLHVVELVLLTTITTYVVLRTRSA